MQVHENLSACLAALAGARLFSVETDGARAYCAASFEPGNRSLNLANAVALVVYEAWRQNAFRGAS